MTPAVWTGLLVLALDAGAAAFLLWAVQPDVPKPLLMMAAAATGGSISTTVAYLKHACSQGDFQARYVPWYPGRVVLASLLGLMLSLFDGGGIFGEPSFAALSGLFSREALLKLQAMFPSEENAK